jgi:uncharacterized LabA/DUF88 family protein
MKRVTFLIDGFNLYHSVKQASVDLKLGGRDTKWLDIDSLCRAYLYLFGKAAHLEEIYYFSALATHLQAVKPDVTQRHSVYIAALESKGIKVELGRFKMKTIRCDYCGKMITRHEEKETDVAISARLLEILMTNKCDTAVLVTGDTDLAAGVKVAQKLFPQKEICFTFPYGRKNKELAQLVNTSFQISKKSYTTHQFPDPIVLKDGRSLTKPAKW